MRPSRPTDPFAALLLDIKDEIDAAKAERQGFSRALGRFEHANLDGAVAVARSAQESAEKARRSLAGRREDLEARMTRLRLLTALCGAVGGLLVAGAILWFWLTYAPALPWLCETAGATHGVTGGGDAYCVSWDG